MAGSDSKAFKNLKAKITEQTRTIMREMMTKFRREEKQEMPVPQPRPFDLDAEALRRQQIEEG